MNHSNHRIYWNSNPEFRLNYLLEFTRIYKSFNDNQIAERELAILKHQVPSVFLPPGDNTILCGGMKYPPLVFAPQGQAPQGGFAYIFDEEKLNELEKSGNFSKTENDSINKLREFWRREDTSFKTRASYPELLQKGLPSDNWTGESGIAFPLYRMSGSQMDLNKLVDMGIPGLKAEIEFRLKNESNPEKRLLLNSMTGALDVFIQLCNFYITEVDNKLNSGSEAADRLLELRLALVNIKKNKPANFLEAVQLVHLYVLIAGSNNYGRMDVYLAPFYERDKKSGKKEEYFISVLESFWKHINDRKITWDGRVIIGGRDRKRLKSEDELSILIMETTRRVKDILPQLTLRCYQGMDSKVLDKAYSVIGEGNPYPMLYNDDVNIPAAMKAFQVSEEIANDCIPFGCGEYVLYHKSFGTPSGLINLLKVLEVTLNKGKDRMGGKTEGTREAGEVELNSFENLYKAYTLNLAHYCHLLALQEKFEYDMAGKASPFLFMSILFDDCIQRGSAIFNGGICHLGGTLETYGNTNTADSLYVINQLVYEENRFSLEDFVEILNLNFIGNEKLRKECLEMPKYGNNIQEIDNLMKRVHTDVCLITKAQAEKAGLDSYLVVNINNSANTIFGKFTAASADGRQSGKPLANGNTPGMGMDKDGVTSLLNSLVKMPLDIHAGASQNIKFSKEMFSGKLSHTKSLINSYFKMGGAQLMITCVGKEELENALKEPEKYSNLLVRVGGFSARFVELDSDVQIEILSRTLY